MSIKDKNISDENNHPLPDWIFNSGLFYVVITDMEGKYLYVNDFFIKKFQSVDTDITNKYFTETVIAEDIESAIEAATKCIQNPSQSFEVDLRKPIGLGQQTFHSRWVFSSLSNQQDIPIGIFSVGYEISSISETVNYKIFQKINIFKILKNSSDGCFHLSKNLELKGINKSASKFLGIPSDNAENVFNERIKQKVNTPCIDAILSSINSDNATLFQDNIEKLDLYYSGIAIPDNQGVSVILRDNTREQKSKIRLQESENKLKAILDSTSDCIILINQDFNIIAFNKVAFDLCHGIHQNKLVIGNDFRDFISEAIKEDFYKSFTIAINGSISKFEQKLTHEDGTTTWLEFVFYPVYDSNQQMIGVSKVVKDITESKNYLAKIQAQYEKLKEIAWVQSHEVRSPLANIMGLIDMLKNERLNLEEEEIESLFNSLLCESEKLDLKIRKITKSTEEHIGQGSQRESDKLTNW
ncbi:PAS domain S-box-containing protein [Belliella buryatensis]|uniref:histidine kinase n=1 Tax=Belliella buryatensis TaxID=1500549 RepID=A0A239CFP9_9BACT|nr:PAS domain-containing protein [Belliella buryatensis]SNS18930.1 PAS domain S-box-containing protein [Belliella buryatensis]